VKKILLIAGLIIAVAIAGFFLVQYAGLLFGTQSAKIPAQDLKITSPVKDQEVSNPIIVEGQAKGTWFFEASFPIKVLDENENVLATSYVQAQSDWMTEDFVPFKGEISYVSQKGGNGFLVFAKDNPSGLPENDKEYRLPIVLKATDSMAVKAFFSNSQLDPEFTCNKVFPVDRNVLKTPAVAKAALEELLQGPNEQEKIQGFFTLIPEGVQIQSLNIENKIATVDFNSKLEDQIGGSCRVSGIRAEITETLKQFPTVDDVVISINGRTEDILQP